MKIAIFISRDYSFTFPLLNTVIPELSKCHDISGIIQFPDTLIGLKGMKIYLKYLEIFGFLTTSKLALDSISNRFRIHFNFFSRKSQYRSFDQMALDNKISYLKYNSPNDKDVIQWVKNNQVDVIFIFIGHILKKEIINSPQVCIINKHGSILPSNRGVLPVFWAMLNDENIGFSLHRVTEKLDSGEILFQKAYAKSPRTLYEWYRIIYNDAPAAIMDVIKQIEDKEMKEIIVDDTIKPSYHSLPTKDDVKEFYKKGLKII